MAEGFTSRNGFVIEAEFCHLPPNLDRLLGRESNQGPPEMPAFTPRQLGTR